MRVVVKRPQRPTHVTDFVACANCAAVYYVPAWQHVEKPTEDTFKRDAADAAKDYRKPGRGQKR